MTQVNPKTGLVFLFAIMVTLAGCATPTTQRAKVDDALVEIEARKQREIAFDAILSEKQRLNEVTYPLAKAAVPFCESKALPSLGLTFANKYSFPEQFRDTAITKLGVGEPLQIMELASTSPARQAGLLPGNILVALNQSSVPIGEDAARGFAEQLTEALKADQETQISVVRNNEKLVFAVTPALICDYPVLLSDGNEVNAYADGQRIVVTKGMLRFTENDNELALVVAHEMAHNAMRHMKAKMQNYVLGSLFDILAAVYGVNTQGTFGDMAAQAYSQEFEAEADYVGLYIMARAGLPIDGSANFWRRMAVAHPGTIGRNHAASHPATAERFVAIEQTVVEIGHKLSSGAPLEPQYKEKTVPDKTTDR